jgi:hypothetical protein
MESKYSTYDIRVRAVAAVRQGMAVTKVAKAYQVSPFKVLIFKRIA